MSEMLVVAFLPPCPRLPLYAMLNDASGAPAGSLSEALARYHIAAVPWSKRESVREELAA